MTTSESINEIAAALAKAQGAMKNATLNKVNPHFKSKYADLAGIRDAVVPVLAANGIAVVQTLAFEESATCVQTRLLHTSGQWIESRCPIPNGGDMQKMGSAITYARRYSLSAICGIAADEDDDANAAVQAPGGGPKAVVEAPPEGYEDWLITMSESANHGVTALKQTIKNSRKDHWTYLPLHDNARYEAIKARAEAVDKKAAGPKAKAS